MGGDQPTVSVIIPTYYRNDRLREAIGSVKRDALSETEIIVVDDSGESHAETVVKGIDVAYHAMEENLGQNAALNIGLNGAQGDYIQFLDDDDQLINNKLQRQVGTFRDFPDCGVVYCGVKSPNGGISRPNPDRRGNILEPALRFDVPACVTSSMLFRREVINSIRPLPTPPGSTDTYMKIELAQITEFEFIDEPLILKGQPDGSVGSSYDAILGMWNIFEKYDSLYDQFPDETYNLALSSAYNREAMYLLDTNVWSPKAILALGKANYYYPGVKVEYLGRFAGSLLGRPGTKFVKYIHSRVSS